MFRKVLLGILFLCLVQVNQRALFAEESGKSENTAVSAQAQAPTPEEQQKFIEGQQKMASIMTEARAKIAQLTQEHSALAAKNASPEELDAKAKEIDAVKKAAIAKIRELGPVGMPLAPHEVRPALSPEKQAELKSLVEKRRQMISEGAGHKEVAEISQKIQDIYSPKPAPSSQAGSSNSKK